MSDPHHEQHEGHGEPGGHEVDQVPDRRLFNLLFGFAALTFLASVLVIEVFNRQVDRLEEERGKSGAFQLAEYQREMQAAADNWGRVEVKEADGSVTNRYHMPLENARRAVLEDPSRLKAEKPPRGWKTADDQAPAAAPTPTLGGARFVPAPSMPAVPPSR